MTNAEARFNNSLRPRKPEGSLGRTAQDGHLDSHTAPELCDDDDDCFYIALFSALEQTHCAVIHNVPSATRVHLYFLYPTGRQE